LKNQYFGDINDYLKYALLRAFVLEGLSVGVFWMLTQDDGRSDGLKTAYLRNARRWRGLDPDLFDCLTEAVVSRRHISSASDARCLPRARFFAETVPTDPSSRKSWLRHGLDALEAADIVLFDPDNGIEVQSTPFGRTGSDKYLYWHEIEDSWGCGHSLLIFQHFARVNRADHIRRLADRLQVLATGASIVPVKTSHVLFLLAAQEGHAPAALRAAGNIVAASRGAFQVDSE